MDVLTGVRNRNSMNNRVTQLIEKKVDCKSIGVIFADLNGLKTVNDRDGHEAGDRLLRNAANLLKLNFDNCEIYRAGGDEFVVLAIDKPKDWLSESVERLRKKSDIPGKVSFALGLAYDDDANDIRKTMHEADTLMYADKERYYNLFPDLRRK